ncbi:MAG: DUF1573 domain-containing protein [Bacteroidota bacterium]
MIKIINMRSFAFLLLCSLPLFLFSQVSIEKTFPSKKGNLRFSKETFKMQYIKTTEIRKDSVQIYNAGKKNIDLKVDLVSNYIKLKVYPEQLKPGERGYFVVSYNAQIKGDYGNSFEGVAIHTNDELEPEKSFFIMAYIEEDFSGLSKEDRANAPKIKFSREGFDFGKVKKGTKVDCSFEFSNEGKRDLVIRKTKASCGCTATTPEKTILKPGEKSKINISIDTSALHGDQLKSVFVYCNDPTYSSVTLTLTGIVE